MSPAFFISVIFIFIIGLVIIGLVGAPFTITTLGVAAFASIAVSAGAFLGR